MAKDGFIDVGREYDSCGCCCPSPKSGGKKGEKKISYPTLYISGVKGLDLATGEITFTAKGKVVSVSNRTNDEKGDQWSVEIEVHSINAPGAKEEAVSSDGPEAGLEKALNKISSQKAKKEEPEEEGGADDEE